MNRRIPAALVAALLLTACRPAGPAETPAGDAGNAIPIPGLTRAVTVEIDRLGVPTISAASRDDALRGLGYLVARDRLFQLDLLRRASAGRLAEIFGADLVPADEQQRRYGMAQVAAAVVAGLPAAQRAALAAYAEGVNAYLGTMGDAVPMELAVLGYTPEPWRVEDSVLVVLGMFQALSVSEDQERTRTILARTLPADVVAFLVASPDPYTDALIAGQARAEAPLPMSGLRTLMARLDPATAPAGAALSPAAGEAPPGSNAWAIAGSRTADGRAILANDMHLDLGVPSVWYRAALRYGDTEIAGVVLPGVPLVVAGSNRHVAWGITNLEGDVHDLIRLEVDPERPDHYRTPAGWQAFTSREERIAVRGADEVTVTVRGTIWGPVAARPLLGAPVAVRWTALDPAAVDLGLLELGGARTVDDAVAMANRAAGPANNVIVAGRDGRVAWTVTGRIPQRRGFDGTVATSWADGKAGWDGYVAATLLPRLVDPPAGLVVSANQRMIAAGAGPDLGHDFGHGYRAFRITERLRALKGADEAAMLAVQLDTRGGLYDAYRDAAVAALTDAAVASRPPLAAARRALQGWDGRAEVDSVGMALLVRFRRVVAEGIFAAWLAEARKVEPDVALLLSDIDTPVQRMLRERPAGLVPPPETSWDDFVVAALEQAAAQLATETGGAPLDTLPWGASSKVRIAHPLGALPDLERLNMPAEPLAGCGFCVRMAAGTLGASERLVVAPGHERDGILHMPGGQSGDPDSEHYDDQQGAWLRGERLPLLAGPAIQTLTLAPAGAAKEEQP